MLRSKGKITALVWGMALCVGALAFAPALGAERVGYGAAEARIFAALDRSTTIEFIDEPLSNVVDFLREVHQIDIQIDQRGLEDEGVGSDATVTKCLDGISLRSALNLVLRDLGLDWTVTNEVLLITSPELARSTLITCVHDLGAGNLVAVQDSKGNRSHDFDTLIEAIQTTIAPESWDKAGGPGNMAPLKCRGAVVLIVRQTCDVQREVTQLLEDLAKIADKYGDDVFPIREPSPPTSVGSVELPSVAPSGSPKPE